METAVEDLMERCASMTHEQWAEAGWRFALLMGDDSALARAGADVANRPRVASAMLDLRRSAAARFEVINPGRPSVSDERSAFVHAVLAAGMSAHLDEALVREMSMPLLSVIGEAPVRASRAAHPFARMFGVGA